MSGSLRETPRVLFPPYLALRMLYGPVLPRWLFGRLLAYFTAPNIKFRDGQADGELEAMGSPKKGFLLCQVAQGCRVVLAQHK